MSSIGRIFVILNLILAAAFLGWASTMLSKGSEWKDKYEAEVTARTEAESALQDELSKARNDLNAERTTKDTYREERDSARADNDRNKAQLDDEQQANAQLRASIQGIEATLGDYNKTNAALEAAKDAAVTESRDLERQRDAANGERDAAQTAQRNAEEGLGSASNQIADLERKLTSATKEASKLEAELGQLVAATGYDRTGASGAPLIEGRVLQVNNDLQPGLVALNVGSDQGVKRGYTFQIFNGGVWKAQVRVESVQASMSSALIMDLKPGESISQGDNATTIL